MFRLEKSCAFRSRNLTCQRSQFQAYRPPTHWTRPSVRLAHATKFHASPRSSTLDVGRAAGLPTRSLCVAENKATRTYQIGSKRIFFFKLGIAVGHARVRAQFFEGIAQNARVEFNGSKVSCAARGD